MAAADFREFDHWQGEFLPPIAGRGTGRFDWWYANNVVSFVNPYDPYPPSNPQLTYFDASATIYAPVVELVWQFITTTTDDFSATIYAPQLDLVTYLQILDASATIHDIVVGLTQLVVPTTDVLTTGWDTYPVASQALYAQIDETTPSDSDYIYADGA